MKKYFKSIAGVTLLEIMLVLAIAAMVIVMSIRYYETATSSENANILMDMIQNITAAGDNIALGTGGYSGVSTSTVSPIAGANNMKTPYGTSVTISSGASTSYKVTIPGLPASVCSNLSAKLSANTRFTGQNSAASCTSATNTFTYTYVSTSG